MSKFGDAFNRGQKARENAERNRAEIDNVFSELSNDINAQTNGHVSIEFKKAARLGLPGATAPAGNVNVRELSAVEVETYDALMAIARGHSNGSIELCNVKFDPHGYPVTIAYPGKSIAAYDRESLENALVKMVEHPDVAAKLERVLRIAESPSGSEQAALPTVLEEETTDSND